MTGLKSSNAAGRWKDKRRAGLLLATLLLLLALIFAGVGCGSGQSGDTAPVTAATAVTADTGGRLQVSENYFDAGTVKTGDTVEHAFELKNTGTGPLSLGDPSVKLLEGC